MGIWLLNKDPKMRDFGLRMHTASPSPSEMAVHQTDKSTKKRYYVPVHQHVFVP